ncbi:DNA polymerase-3 subunit gamma/tau [Parelusimicrobium proximum]|uniref:DNA polymerase III subunit gamma/tau n=1 Tax=Parelusimicrobium proximum TaxID=3228953 RepID=UPI003D1762DC
MTTEDRFISLANKYRPQTFKDMVGQEPVSKTLTNAIKLGRIGHAYLFYGPRGCGKTTSARIFAKALNCTGHGDKPTPEPCGKCPQCLEIAASEDIDVLELDAASNTQVEKIREAIIDTVSLASVRDRFKVFILDEVHMLSDSSFNALLKTIEEPPSHVVFILATTEKHKVPATISSRCQTFRFRPIGPEDIFGHLTDLAEAENLKVTPAAVKLIAKNAGGAMRDALTLFDRAIAYSDGQIDETLVSEMLGLMPDDVLSQAMSALINKDDAMMHSAFETIAKEGFDPLSFLRDLKNALGAAFYLSLGHGEEPFKGAKEIISAVSTGFIAALTRKTGKLIDEIKFADNTLLSAEVGLFTIMDQSVDIENLVARLENIEGGDNADAPLPKPKTVSKAASISKTAGAKDKVTEVKITPADVTSTLEITENKDEEPAPKSNAAAGDNNTLWNMLKADFASNPFVSDALNNCEINFISNTEWALHFTAANSFYKTAAEMKADEFDKKAQKICGRKIKFSFLAENEASIPASQHKPKTMPSKITNTFTQKKETAPSFTDRAQAETVKKPETVFISEEKPFIDRDFSKEFVSDSPKPFTGEITDEIKDILGLIPGEVVE